MPLDLLVSSVLIDVFPLLSNLANVSVHDVLWLAPLFSTVCAFVCRSFQRCCVLVVALVGAHIGEPLLVGFRGCCCFLRLPALAIAFLMLLVVYSLQVHVEGSLRIGCWLYSFRIFVALHRPLCDHLGCPCLFSASLGYVLLVGCTIVRRLSSSVLVCRYVSCLLWRFWTGSPFLFCFELRVRACSVLYCRQCSTLSTIFSPCSIMFIHVF